MRNLCLTCLGQFHKKAVSLKKRKIKCRRENINGNCQRCWGLEAGLQLSLCFLFLSRFLDVPARPGEDPRTPPARALEGRATERGRADTPSKRGRRCEVLSHGCWEPDFLTHICKQGGSLGGAGGKAGSGRLCLARHPSDRVRKPCTRLSQSEGQGIGA